MSLESKIQSIRETIHTDYVKPSEEKNKEFIEALSKNDRARDYLQITRGLTPNTIEHFRLGYDADKDAISIPVYKRGELINIKYRHLDEKAKAKYTQEKGAEIWIFNEEGIAKGQENKGILIVEGEFDCMSVWQSGIKNVVSPASGKDSYGIWIELLDTIPKVYISYDNDKPGKQASIDIAERVGTDKSFEVLYPEGIKDANEYFKEYDKEAYKELIRRARPYYKYKYAGVTDIIHSLREKRDDLLKLNCIPFIEWENDWLGVMSGMSNIGKTSVAMNVACELVEKGIPTLVLPIERGIRTVGKRFIQVFLNKTREELDSFSDDEWEKVIPSVVELPLFFSMPNREDVSETIKKAKRLFNTKFVIVDHLDLLVRKSDPKNINVETSTVIQNFKQIAQECGIIFLVIHHIKKQEGVGTIPKKPKIEDLKGSSATYQDPEAVIMLSEPTAGQIEVDILKNKGQMGSKLYEFNKATGKIGRDITDDLNMLTERQIVQRNFENF